MGAWVLVFWIMAYGQGGWPESKIYYIEHIEDRGTCETALTRLKMFSDNHINGVCITKERRI